MRHLLSIFLVSAMAILNAQQATSPVVFAGKYTAQVDKERLTLDIVYSDGQKYAGLLNDGFTTINLDLELIGNTFSGAGTEPTKGTEINVDGHIDGDQLSLFLLLGPYLDPYGEVEGIEIKFKRDGVDTKVTAAANDQSSGVVVFPSGASHPQEMIGTWIKEELYQSGYGDGYMGAGTSQSMTFLSGGRMADAGSSSYMSGSNYSGQSTDQGGGILPGVAWYTVGNQLYLQASANGQTENVHLGKFYIEKNNMLITGTNGEKIDIIEKEIGNRK